MDNTPHCVIGVDEVTIVLFPKATISDLREWMEQVRKVIGEFAYRTSMTVFFGELEPMTNKKPAGCTDALTINEVPWYFAIGWNDHGPNMGVIVRFSVYAWAAYQAAFEEHFGISCNIADFMKLIQSSSYLARISRIDIVADYKNYGAELAPDTIYKGMKDERLYVVDYRGRKSRRRYDGVMSNWEIQTFYIGSKKENSSTRLRIYDKRAEQIASSGFRMNEAQACTSWTRFEVTYRNKYAHQISNDLVKIKSPVELAQYLASKILDRYRFVDTLVNDFTVYTKILQEIANNSEFAPLRSERPENNSLRKSTTHLLKNSSLMQILSKVEAVWGYAAVRQYLEWVLKYYDEVYRYKAPGIYRLQQWIKLNKPSMQGQNIKDCFMEAMLEKELRHSKKKRHK